MVRLIVLRVVELKIFFQTLTYVDICSFIESFIVCVICNFNISYVLLCFNLSVVQSGTSLLIKERSQ